MSRSGAPDQTQVDLLHKKRRTFMKRPASMPTATTARKPKTKNRQLIRSHNNLQSQSQIHKQPQPHRNPKSPQTSPMLQARSHSMQKTTSITSAQCSRTLPARQREPMLTCFYAYPMPHVPGCGPPAKQLLSFLATSAALLRDQKAATGIF